MNFKPIKSDCLKVRETMFDFLKRKKQHQLQQSVKQFDSASKSQVNKSMLQSASGKKPSYDEVVEQPSTIPLFSNRKCSLGKTITVTPKKITFGDENEVEHHYSTRRPLVEMISSNKNMNRSKLMSSVNNQRQNSIKKPTTQPQKSNPSTLSSSTLQPFIRRKLQLSLANISSKLTQILSAGQLASEKNNQLSVELVKFVKEINKEVGSASGIVDKKLCQVKYILNAIDSSLARFTNQQFTSTLELIDQFKQSLSTSFYELQTSISTNLREHYQHNKIKHHQQKSSQIQQLQQLNSRLERQVGRLNRLMEKEGKECEGVLEECDERVRELTERLESMRVEMAEKQRSSSQRIQQLLLQLAEQKQSTTIIKKQLKTLTYQHQQSLLTTHTTLTQQLHSRQQFLLSQIQEMKLTFNKDISQLHKLYQSKQLSYEQRVAQLNQQLADQRYKSNLNKEVGDKILSQANNSRRDLSVLMSKNQQLVGELCKINGEFYQHWLALKDIKTLSQRLNIYQYFERIYMDLSFDLLLFIQ